MDDNIKVKYIAIYGMMDTPNAPPSKGKFTKCEYTPIHKYEICNSAYTWFKSNNVYKYFRGLETGGYKITAKVADKFIEAWKNLPSKSIVTNR